VACHDIRECVTSLPRIASGLVCLHVSALGAIGIPAVFSLRNERVDPYSPSE